MSNDPQATQYDPTPPLPAPEVSTPIEGSTRHQSLSSPPSESVIDRFPTFEPPALAQQVADPLATLSTLRVGQRLGNYHILQELGSGSFGRVFLARQESLDRLVALKVTTQSSGEAQALGGLDHDHIVSIFHEEMLPGLGLYLLPLQYVPGMTLSRFLHEFVPDHPNWTGADLLEAIRNSGAVPGPGKDEPALDAERLADCDHVEAVCWLGARLAEALDHAHRQRILHRDVKPSNLLLHRNGRILLTDFNLATLKSGQAQHFGGTLSYMAPEHLDAFNPEDPTTPDAVTAQADLYSLGVILFEMFTGQRPFPAASTSADSENLRKLAQERRCGAPSMASIRPDLPPMLNQVVQRCLAPNPADRYASAGELAQVLNGCRELHERDRHIPSGPLTRFARAMPTLTASVLPILPHLLGAGVVFAYSAFWLASHPSRAALTGPVMSLALWYSAIIFPLTGTIAYFLTKPIWDACQQLKGHATLPAEVVYRARQRALCKPFWGTVLSLLGWIPGAALLPTALLVLMPQETGWDVVLQYGISYIIAGLIALTYTEFVDQFLLLRVAYPMLWVDPIQPRQIARKELGPVEDRLRFFQILSGMIPLTTGIALMVGLISASPEQRASDGFSAYLILVTVLMVLGLAGSWLAARISDQLCRAANILTGAPPEGRRN